MEFDLSDFLLSVQIALLRAIRPSLRAVTVDFNQNKNLLSTHFFYDGEITEELKEITSCAITEIDINLPIYYDHNLDFAIRLDFPKKIPIRERLVYLRKEPVLPRYTQKRAIELLKEPILPIVRLLLETQDALLGKVTPALRTVNVSIFEQAKKLSFYLVYDGEISKENLELAKLIVKDASRSFTGYEIDQHINRLDYPGKITYEGQRVAFSRSEDLT